MLSYRTSLEEYTYMSSTASHSLWDLVITRYSWKAQEYDLYAPTREDALGNLVSVKDLGETYFAQNY